jgi:hypothetical protein
MQRNTYPAESGYTFDVGAGGEKPPFASEHRENGVRVRVEGAQSRDGRRDERAAEGVEGLRAVELGVWMLDGCFGFEAGVGDWGTDFDDADLAADFELDVWVFGWGGHDACAWMSMDGT